MRPKNFVVDRSFKFAMDGKCVIFEIGALVVPYTGI